MRRENGPIRRHHLAFLSEKGKGSQRNPVILSHVLLLSSLLLLRLSLLFFFVFLFSLVFARSFFVHLTGEFHGCRRDLYMMMFFFLWLFLHFVSSHFSFPVKLVPPLWCLFCATTMGHFHATAAVVVPMAVSRHDAMHQWCQGGAPPSVVASLIAAPFWGLGYLGLFQP